MKRTHGNLLFDQVDNSLFICIITDSKIRGFSVQLFSVIIESDYSTSEHWLSKFSLKSVNNFCTLQEDQQLLYCGYNMFRFGRHNICCHVLKIMATREIPIHCYQREIYSSLACQTFQNDHEYIYDIRFFFQIVQWFNGMNWLPCSTLRSMTKRVIIPLEISSLTISIAFVVMGKKRDSRYMKAAGRKSDCKLYNNRYQVKFIQIERVLFPYVTFVRTQITVMIMQKWLKCRLIITINDMNHMDDFYVNEQFCYVVNHCTMPLVFQYQYFSFENGPKKIWTVIEFISINKNSVQRNCSWQTILWVSLADSSSIVLSLLKKSLKKNNENTNLMPLKLCSIDCFFASFPSKSEQFSSIIYVSAV